MRSALQEKSTFSFNFKKGSLCHSGSYMQHKEMHPTQQFTINSVDTHIAYYKPVCSQAMHTGHLFSRKMKTSRRLTTSWGMLFHMQGFSVSLVQYLTHKKTQITFFCLHIPNTWLTLLASTSMCLCTGTQSSSFGYFLPFFFLESPLPPRTCMLSHMVTGRSKLCQWRELL